MWISMSFCVVFFGFGLIAKPSKPAPVSSANPPGLTQVLPAVQVTESERKALLARAEALEPGDFPALLDKAEKSDSESQFLLGYAYAYGRGTDEDLSQALAWFQRAAVVGNPMAQNGLGMLYRACKGVPKGPTEAVTWFRKAADERLQTNFLEWTWSPRIEERKLRSCVGGDLHLVS